MAGFDYSGIRLRRSSTLITHYVDERCLLDAIFLLWLFSKILCRISMVFTCLWVSSFCFEFLLLLWAFYFVVSFQFCFAGSSLCNFGSSFVKFYFVVNFFFCCSSWRLFVCFLCDFLFCCGFLLLLLVSSWYKFLENENLILKTGVCFFWLKVLQWETPHFHTKPQC